jgi:hypothetical protein
LSPKPAIGFQAASGAPLTPSASQPFQGKSRSFTVRTKIGAFSPARASKAMFSMPAVNTVLKYSRLTV